MWHRTLPSSLYFIKVIQFDYYKEVIHYIWTLLSNKVHSPLLLQLRYALYHTDDALQTLHARVPVGLVKWDDHEFCNDPHPNLAGAQNHQELCTNENGARPGDPDFVPNVETVFTGQPPCDKDEGDWLVRVNAATKAFYEWMPIRYSQATFEDPVLRRERSQEFHWGNLVDGYSPEEVLNAACEDEGCGCEELSPLSTSSLFFQLVYITTDPSQYVPGTEFYNYLAFSLQEHAACITSSREFPLIF